VPKPFSPHFRTVIALFATLTFEVTSGSLSGASTTGTSTAQSCTGTNLKTDLQINRCLTKAILNLDHQMSSAVAIESTYLGASSKVRDLRLEEIAQSAFSKYARSECNAQTNPYSSGTIAPIVYGECIISLDRQRLALLRKEIFYFKNDGEAGNASSMVRSVNL
jgi:uncharacterized protein YecT (DUF1311 family)